MRLRLQEKVRYYLKQTVKRSLGPEMEAIDALPTKEEKAAAMEVISGE